MVVLLVEDAGCGKASKWASYLYFSSMGGRAYILHMASTVFFGWLVGALRAEGGKWLVPVGERNGKD